MGSPVVDSHGQDDKPRPSSPLPDVFPKDFNHPSVLLTVKIVYKSSNQLHVDGIVAEPAPTLPSREQNTGKATPRATPRGGRDAG